VAASTLYQAVTFPAKIQDALNAAPTEAAGNAVAVIEITDGGHYTETLAIDTLTRLELRAADGHRPMIELSGDLTIRAANSADVTLNGLLITVGAIRVPNDSTSQLRRLRIVHCTLVPGLTLAANGDAHRPGAPSLIVDLPGVSVEIDHCILGGIQAVAEATVSIADSIIDAGAEAAVAYAAPDSAAETAGGPLTVARCTLRGKVHTRAMELASDSIFLAALVERDVWTAPIRSDRKQEGCVRFCYIAPHSQVPRRFRCQPDMALAKRAAELGLASTKDLSDPDRLLVESRLSPRFTALRYGEAAYGQLSTCCAVEIRKGASDESEMGAFHHLQHFRRETDLRTRLVEYLRFGLEAGIRYVT
jgi:hypothetical protein